MTEGFGEAGTSSGAKLCCHSYTTYFFRARSGCQDLFPPMQFNLLFVVIAIASLLS